MRFLLVAYILFLPLCSLLAQTNAPISPPNIVPNPSFEKFSGTPIGWYYKGAHFDNVIQYWNSPTSTSPDIFGKGVRVPSSWKEKGFGDQSAYHGERFIGLTMYGCSEGKPHCREYVQIQLSEPLVIGQRYEVVFYIAHLPRSMYCNNMGIYFSEKQFEFRTEEFLEFEPQVKENNVAAINRKAWKKVSKEFVATSYADHLIIGNFYKDEGTETLRSSSQDFKYAYYYFDNISVKKRQPILAVPKHTNDLLSKPVSAGDVIVLKNIFFDLNKSALLPRSSQTLQDLIALMQQYPSMYIEIRGHTDNQGNSNYNQELSIDRAQSVVNHLILQGQIDRQRLKYIGYGDTQPISSNETLEGRQQNRRVEFRVLSL
jgi:outer membrane protein OmpA-like peptidoglycan-associated protein